MSSKDPTASDGLTVEQQIAALTQITDDLRRSTGNARTVRLILLLGFIALAAVTLSAFYNLSKRVRSDAFVNQLSAATQKRLEQNSKRYMDHVQWVADQSGPAIRDAFNEQAHKDTPIVLKALEAEGDAFVDGMKEKLSERMEAHCRAMADRHEEILKKEFPLIKDEKLMDKMNVNLETALERVAKKYYVAQLGEQMDKLFDAWQKFPAAPPPAKGDADAEDQLVVDLTDLLSHKLTETHVVNQK